MREPVIRVLPALGVDAAMRALPRPARELLYEIPRGKMLTSLDAGAAWFDGARSLVKHLSREIDRPHLDVPGFKRKLSPQECWSVLPVLYGALNVLRDRGELQRELGREFLDAEMLSVLNAAFAQFANLACTWAIYCSRFDEAICWIDNVNNDDRGRRPRRELVVHAEPPRKRTFTVDGVPRVAYQAGGYFGDPGVRWASWPADRVGLPADQGSIDVYIQSHALQRVFERLSATHHSVAHFIMTLALNEPRVTVRPDGKIWAECYSGRGLLGYFVGDVVDGCVLLRSFLFLTMQGTAEHELLKRRLHVRRRDIQFMRLDDMATYMKSDLADDAELAGILRECGLGHLLELRNIFDGDVMLGQARFMRTYLGLPQAA